MEVNYLSFCFHALCVFILPLEISGYLDLSWLWNQRLEVSVVVSTGLIRIRADPSTKKGGALQLFVGQQWGHWVPSLPFGGYKSHNSAISSDTTQLKHRQLQIPKHSITFHLENRNHVYFTSLSVFILLFQELAYNKNYIQWHMFLQMGSTCM